MSQEQLQDKFDLIKKKKEELQKYKEDLKLMQKIYF